MDKNEQSTLNSLPMILQNSFKAKISLTLRQPSKKESEGMMQENGFMQRVFS